MAKNKVLEIVFDHLEEKLHPRQRSTNACPVSVSLIKENKQKFRMIESTTFPGFHSLGYQSGTLEGEPVLMPLGVFDSNSKTYTASFKQAARLILNPTHGEWYKRTAEEKHLAAAAFLRELVFPFVAGDLVAAKSLAFALPKALTFEQHMLPPKYFQGQIQAWSCHPHGTEGNKIFVFNTWNFNMNTGEYEGVNPYMPKVQFITNASETATIEIKPLPEIKYVDNDPMAAIGPGNGSYSQKCRKYAFPL